MSDAEFTIDPARHTCTVYAVAPGAGVHSSIGEVVVRVPLGAPGKGAAGGVVAGVVNEIAELKPPVPAALLAATCHVCGVLPANAVGAVYAQAPVFFGQA